MRCFAPIDLRQEDGHYIQVPCGKCGACKSRKRSEWVFRLQEEYNSSAYALFITLTYDDNSLVMKNGVASLDKNDVQKFMKRYRKYLDAHGVKLRFYLCGEYGEKSLRPHYHAIFFYDKYLDTVKADKDIMHFWQKGSVNYGNVSEASISYVCKYVMKIGKCPEGALKPFALMSRRPGLGYQYIERCRHIHEKDHDYSKMYVTGVGGQKIGMPRFLRTKIYGEKLNPIIREKTMSRIEEESRSKEYEVMRHYYSTHPGSTLQDYLKHKIESMNAYNRKIKGLNKNDKL